MYIERDIPWKIAHSYCRRYYAKAIICLASKGDWDQAFTNTGPLGCFCAVSSFQIAEPRCVLSLCR